MSAATMLTGAMVMFVALLCAILALNLIIRSEHLLSRVLILITGVAGFTYYYSQALMVWRTFG